MAYGVSSASTRALAWLAQRGEAIVGEEVSVAGRLDSVLSSFQATCREYPVDCDGLASGLRGHASGTSSLEHWVRQVGVRFAQADGLYSTLQVLETKFGIKTLDLGIIFGGQTEDDGDDEDEHDSRWRWRIDLDWPLLRGLFFRITAPAWLSALWDIADGWDWWQRLTGGDDEKTPEMPSVWPEGDEGTTSDGAEESSFEDLLEDDQSPNWPFPGHKTLQGFPEYKDGTLHTGIDIVPDGSADWTVNPVGPGEVVKVVTDETQSAYGKYVVVRHWLADGTEVYTLYAHLASVTCAVGAWIDGGDTIGVMGETGNATGPHLHLEVYRDINAHGNFYGQSPGDYDDPDSAVSQMLEQYLDPEEFLNGDAEFCSEKPDSART